MRFTDNDINSARMNAIDRFCTPPSSGLTEFDHKILADAEKMQIPFEEYTLNSYRFGIGKTVLLVHGWGSRASHMALIGRYLSRSGFRAILFDTPAHSSGNQMENKKRSDFFEICRAISAVAESCGDVYGMVGHSLGAIAALFAVTGHPPHLAEGIQVKKLALISSPASVNQLIENHCRQNRMDASECVRLKRKLEMHFGFSSDDYKIATASRNISADVLFVHDRDDPEFQFEEIRTITEAIPDFDIHATDGLGHHKILSSRNVMSKLRSFLTG